jgi:hypothetical protein
MVTRPKHLMGYSKLDMAREEERKGVLSIEDW